MKSVKGFKGASVKGGTLLLEAEGYIVPLLYYIGRASLMSSVTYKGETYGGNWHDCTNPDNDIFDDTDCLDTFPQKIASNPDKIKFNIEYVEYDDNYLEDNEGGVDEEFLELIEKYDPENVKIIGFDTIKMTNKSGYNHDHRGSNHCHLALPYKRSVTIDEHITLSELARNFFILKSHKFDKWYELFDKATLKRDGDDFNVEISFDHGS